MTLNDFDAREISYLKEIGFEETGIMSKIYEYLPYSRLGFRIQKDEDNNIILTELDSGISKVLETVYDAKDGVENLTW